MKAPSHSVGSTSRPLRVILPRWVPRIVHSWTTRSAQRYWRRVSAAKSGKTVKIPESASLICSRPTLRSPVVWFWKTESSVCIETIASTSWAFHAAL